MDSTDIYLEVESINYAIFWISFQLYLKSFNIGKMYLKTGICFFSDGSLSYWSCSQRCLGWGPVFAKGSSTLAHAWRKKALWFSWKPLFLPSLSACLGLRKSHRMDSFRNRRIHSMNSFAFLGGRRGRNCKSLFFQPLMIEKWDVPF